MKWEPKSLDELGSVARGKSKHRPRDAAHLYGGPYPFIQTGDVKHSALYINSFSQTYSDAGLAQSKLWPKGTLCITIAANIAETAILGIDACFPDSVIGFIADENKCDAKFIKYTFDILKHKYQQFSQGAAQDNLSLEKLLSLKFLVPSANEQRKIAAILSAYDDLIENNLKRIALLEEAARLLYREWFVRLRFPGHEHTRIVDSVPEGWERTFVPDVIDIDPKTNVPKDGEKWFVEMASLPLNSMVISNLQRRTGNSGSKFQNGDTLLARITPSLENGKTGFVNFLAEGETAFGSTEFIVLRPKQVSSEFVYCLARTYDFRENAIKSMVGSSGRQRVQASCFDDFLLALPPKSLMEQFSELASSCFKQIRIVSLQNEKLKQARDLLLPRLISGELTVDV